MTKTVMRQGPTVMDGGPFPTRTHGGKNVPNPIVWPAGRMGTKGNEVNPMHRHRQYGVATEAQATAMV
ncbi:MAG: hypothetical protein LCH79_04345, partial [Proteobacteria bacterium]|nr:hypothetical protein [Pseudomonadota bacterium]